MPDEGWARQNTVNNKYISTQRDSIREFLTFIQKMQSEIERGQKSYFFKLKIDVKNNDLQLFKYLWSHSVTSITAMFVFFCVCLSTEENTWMVIQHNNTELTRVRPSPGVNQHSVHFDYSISAVSHSSLFILHRAKTTDREERKEKERTGTGGQGAKIRFLCFCLPPSLSV